LDGSFISTHLKTSPKKRDEILAEQYRHSFPIEYRHLLQSLRKSGAISDKSFERIRTTGLRWERDYGLVNKSPLIVELGGKAMSLGEGIKSPE